MLFKRKKPKIYSFIGLPGSGKGTQVDNFAVRKKAIVIGTGKLIREAIDGKYDLKQAEIKEIKSNYDLGEPQNDEVIFKLIKNRLKKAKKHNIIFDNFPFSAHQSRLLDQFAEENGYEKPLIIYINVSPKTVIKRILKRRICSKCGSSFGDTKSNICAKCGAKLEEREDDNLKTVEKRINFYTPRIDQIKKMYPEHIEINGEDSIQNISKEINQTIK